MLHVTTTAVERRCGIPPAPTSSIAVRVSVACEDEGLQGWADFEWSVHRYLSSRLLVFLIETLCLCFHFCCPTCSMQCHVRRISWFNNAWHLSKYHSLWVLGFIQNSKTLFIKSLAAALASVLNHVSCQHFHQESVTLKRNRVMLTLELFRAGMR